MTDAAKTDYENEAEKFMSLHLFAREHGKASVIAYLKSRDQRIRAEARREAFLEAATYITMRFSGSGAGIRGALIAKAAAQSAPDTQEKERP